MVAPLARVIAVVSPTPAIVSKESILAAKASASTVPSLTAIVVRPVALSNSLLPIAVANVPRSLRLLDARAVTLVKSTASVVFSLIVFRSEALLDVASPAAITIVYA